MNRNVEETIEHLSFLARHFSEQDVKSVLIVLLLELGVPSHYDGFEYLERTVPIVWEYPSLDMACVYEAVADQYEWRVDNVQIENAIRSAIKVAWDRRDPDVWRHYFLDMKRRADKRPANTEFISMLTQILILWKGCCKAQKKHEEVLI